RPNNSPPSSAKNSRKPKAQNPVVQSPSKKVRRSPPSAAFTRSAPPLQPKPNSGKAPTPPPGLLSSSRTPNSNSPALTASSSSNPSPTSPPPCTAPQASKASSPPPA